MNRIEISSSSWALSLVEAVNKAKSGDVIVVSTEAQKKLGEITRNCKCPMKNIRFEIRCNL